MACAVQIFPIVNLAGRKAVEGGNHCLRKTISGWVPRRQRQSSGESGSGSVTYQCFSSAGVDLNRNWPYAWEQVTLALPRARCIARTLLARIDPSGSAECRPRRARRSMGGLQP